MSKSYSSFIPVELLPDYVAAITRTYVGYRGSSPQWSRTTFYSNAAAPIVKEMFESFDSTAVDVFVDVIRADAVLRLRITSRGQLNRLRVLGQIALDKGLGSDASRRFLGKV
ncbi:hypothetical protein [Xanthomonas oryzae]|uniref:hypothetical protein n=1 Tax=Xanthomonas oryzae TaxID=347 RepID=UPI0006AC96CE|nr:hypothetical protein [Xanthomonas oryzae]ALS96398.1 hypothetical protein AXO1947_19955 [Xanthomonas oryzae pv. oryzae]UWI56880.1 hypothetical protein NO430_21420 [Xanthomonas oryzae pv. oryzae]